MWWILFLGITSEKIYEVDIIELNTYLNRDYEHVFDQYIFWRWDNVKEGNYLERYYDASNRYNVVYYKVVKDSRAIISKEERFRLNKEFQEKHGSHLKWTALGELNRLKLPFYDNNLNKWILYLDNYCIHAKVFKVTTTNYDVELDDRQILPFPLRSKL